MMEYKIESFNDVIEEMQPLLEAHWKEVAWYQDDIKLNPDRDRYEMLEEMGHLLIVTARDEEGTLHGYNVNFINYHPHYKDHLFAVNDIIYLNPKCRHKSLAVEMIAYTEGILKDMGVSVVTLHMKTDNPFVALAEHCGFSRQEYLYSKLIGE